MTNKSGDDMSLTDALKNMELLINASHGFPFEEYGTRQNDVVNFQLPIDTNDNVTISDINTAYAEMINQVRQAYINTAFEEKGLILVTLSINENDKSGNTINANVTTGGEVAPTGNFIDCWYYGEDMGMCDGTYAFEKDGGDAIADSITANNPINNYLDCPGPPDEWRLIIENQPLITLQGNNYMFFYPDDGSGFTNEEKQLSANDMSYYYDNEYELIYTQNSSH